jgi:hypothetical protein
MTIRKGQTTMIIRKGQTTQSPSEKTDNTIAIRKGINGQTTIYKTLHRKQKIEQHQPL